MHQFEKIEWDIYIVTFDNLVRTFMQSIYYAKYLGGGSSGRGLDKNQLELIVVAWSRDPDKLAIIVTITWKWPFLYNSSPWKGKGLWLLQKGIGFATWVR